MAIIRHWFSWVPVNVDQLEREVFACDVLIEPNWPLYHLQFLEDPEHGETVHFCESESLLNLLGLTEIDLERHCNIVRASFQFLNIVATFLRRRDLLNRQTQLQELCHTIYPLKRL